MRKIAYWLSLIFIFILPWEGVVRVTSGTLARFAGLALGAFWLLTVFFTRHMRKLGPFQVAVAIFVFWNACSVFWSALPNRTLGHAQTWGQLLLMVLLLWDLYTTRASVLAGLQAFILGCYVALSSALYNFFLGQSYYSNFERYSAGDTNPDGFGFIMAMGIPLAWYLAGSLRKGQASGFLRFINYAYIPLALVGISLSGTRTALLASVIGMAFGLASLTRLRLAARVSIFGLLILSIILLLPYVENLKSFERLGTTGTELTSGTLNNRTNNWQEGLESFQQHPWLGVGGNMYRTVNSLQKDNEGKVSHNSYLSVLVELGLIGFILFLVILAIAFVEAWRQPKWHSWFWLTILTVWGMGAFTLTWETRKSTWFLLSFIVISSEIAKRRREQVAANAKQIEQLKSYPVGLPTGAASD